MLLMKISTLCVAASLFFLASANSSCSELDEIKPVPSEQATTQLLSKAFSVQSVAENVDVSSIIYSAASGVTINKENDEFDFTKATVISYRNSNYTVVSVPSVASANRQIVYKGYNKNGKIEIFGAFNLEVSVNKNGSGFVEYEGGGSSVKFDFSDFKVVKTVTDKAKSPGNTISAAIICDKENRESFSDCYARQVDEVCDGWLGCASLAFPATHTVIAASCSCVG